MKLFSGPDKAIVEFYFHKEFVKRTNYKNNCLLLFIGLIHSPTFSP
jgi:hypothetical protein